MNELQNLFVRVRVKNERILTSLAHNMWKKIDISDFTFVHFTCKMYPL